MFRNSTYLMFTDYSEPEIAIIKLWTEHLFAYTIEQ